jgi:hypothetical protein
MFRAIIKALMALVLVITCLGVTTFNSQAASLTLVSGGCYALASDDSPRSDSGPSFANAWSETADGMGFANATASGGPSGGQLIVTASNGSMGSAIMYSTASVGQVYQVTSTPGDTGTTGQISLEWTIGGGEITGGNLFFAYVYSPEVRVNKQEVVGQSFIELTYNGDSGITFSGSGTFEATLGNLISFSYSAFVEPIPGGGYGEGGIAYLNLGLSLGNFTENPVPLPPTVLLLGSGLLGLAGWRRFRKS